VADGMQFNFVVDPEAAKIVLTAEFPSITLVGNVANDADAGVS